MVNIGVTLIATNVYFLLGVRFVRNFMHHYKGEGKVTFFFFSDTDPTEYLVNGENIKFFKTQHKEWVHATNSKFKNIISLENEEVDYNYYFDADTNIKSDFDESWFLGDIVGGEHYGNRTFLSNGKGFDRTDFAQSYVPLTSKLPYTYHYGAFFGGKHKNVIALCKQLSDWQDIDKKINYEPPVNDESYLNKYFHFNPPYTVPCEKFQFLVSDKGGLENTRNTKLNINHLKKEILLNKNKKWDIKNGKIIYEKTNMVG